MSRRRYVVSSVTGYNIPGTDNPREVTDYMVLDRDYCHRVVASFPSTQSGRPSRFMRRIKAEQLADSLNRGEEAWRDALARDAELTA